MAPAGGICFMLLHALFVLRPMPLAAKCIAGAVLITAVEFLFGWVVNIRLGRSVMGLFQHEVQALRANLPPLFLFLGFADSTRFAVEQVAASSCASLFVVVMSRAISVFEKAKTWFFAKTQIKS